MMSYKLQAVQDLLHMLLNQYISAFSRWKLDVEKMDTKYRNEHLWAIVKKKKDRMSWGHGFKNVWSPTKATDHIVGTICYVQST